ncbi:unnamed protein product [Kluyveromyces dobzhanskii CBS 2104]|uniref:WGS project CCBQ000000000 data, contig 00015 n=1 Tax=Kluyveromyces dobzhanskii CBS 2104 TaxID=1427455 RepID=A0A0A8L901_9SACH|nr:unnamed protein product [Kluyveromyces dobzhanskii CBS 2104]
MILVTGESLEAKRKLLYSLFNESLFKDENPTSANKEIDDKVVSELLAFEDMIYSFQRIIELKYSIRIRYEPKFTIEGDPHGVDRYDEEWIEEMNQLVKSVDFRKEFIQRYEVWLMESRVLLKESLNEKLQSKLMERRKSTTSLDSDLNKSEVDDHNNKNDLRLPNAATNIKGKTLQVNKKITSNLLRTNQILRSSVLQSELNIDELSQQTDTLMVVNDKFDRFKAMSQASTKLIKAINNSSYQEKQKVYAAIAFFAGCIAWVLWRRIFKYPVKLAFWLVFKLFKSFLYTVGLVKGSVSTNAPEHTSFSSTLSSITETVVDHVSSSTVSAENLNLTSVIETELFSTLNVTKAIGDSFDKLMDEL